MKLGNRKNTGKPRYSLLPGNEIEQVIAAGEAIVIQLNQGEDIDYAFCLNEINEKRAALSKGFLYDDIGISNFHYIAYLSMIAKEHTESKANRRKFIPNKTFGFNLLPITSVEGVIEAFEHGAKKYSKDNWKLGLPASQCLDSIFRHYSEIIKGNLLDDESGLNHYSHIVANCLMANYSITKHPVTCDDLVNPLLNQPRIALDLDDVVFDFKGGYAKYKGEDALISNDYWDCSYEVSADLTGPLKGSEEFWTGLTPLVKEINYEVAMYISHRNIPEEWTRTALSKAGLPQAKVIHTTQSRDKIDVIRDNNIDILVDDKVDTYRWLNREGIKCFLHKAAHNTNIWNRKRSDHVESVNDDKIIKLFNY